MQRWIVGILAAVLALFVLACAPEGGTSDGKSQPQPAQPAGGPQRQPLNTDPAVNQPGHPQPDPGHCQQDCDNNTAAFFLDWISQTKMLPRIEYSTELGGPQIPVPANEMHVWKDSKGYHGAWEHLVHVRAGQTIGFSAFGTPSFTWLTCSVAHDGQFHSVQVQVRNCATSYTIT